MICLPLAVTVLWTSSAFAAPENSPCSELSRYIPGDKKSVLPDPSRKLTEAELRLLDKSKIELLAATDYQKGAFVVDADNDGKEDLFAWNIQGSGRYVSAEVFDFSASKAGDIELAPKASLDLGVLEDPRFVRFQRSNYLVSTNTGDSDGIQVDRLVKTPDGKYEQHTVCVMQTVVKPETSCRHPACLKLKDIIQDPKTTGSFVNVEWPHKYFGPAGLEVYFSPDWSTGDFDNTGKPTALWRIGRLNYIHQDVYWTWLGQGDAAPQVDPKIRPLSEGQTARNVLPGTEHDRLRRTLAQQSEVLSTALHRPVSLPNEGQFFLFKANENRTYWAWDFGEPPYGEEIHIAYTNARKSDYIGTVRVKRSPGLTPCTSKCSTPLDQ